MKNKIIPIIKEQGKMKTANEIVKEISADLRRLVKQADQLYKEAQSIVGAEHKSKLLAKRKRRYTLNPHRVGRLFPDEIKDRPLRKEAREIQRKLGQTFQNMLNFKRVLGNGSQDIERMANLVVSNLQNLDIALEKLPKWLDYLQKQVKLLCYERRRELELYEKVFGKGPVKGRKSVRTVGDTEMAKGNKQSRIKKLLQDLAKATDQGEKRQFRVELRNLGHRGGLGKGGGRPEKAVKKAKKVSKKKAAS